MVHLYRERPYTDAATGSSVRPSEILNKPLSVNRPVCHSRQRQFKRPQGARRKSLLLAAYAWKLGHVKITDADWLLVDYAITATIVKTKALALQLKYMYSSHIKI